MKKAFLLWLATLLAWIPSPARAEVVLSDVFARQTTSLNGQWHVIVDPYDTGYYDYRRQPYDEGGKVTGGYALDQQAKNKTELVEYNFDTSPTLNVPGDWNSQNDKLFYYEGSVWYRTKFDVNKSAPGPPAVCVFRRGQLRGRRLSQRQEARQTRRRLHAVRLRNHQPGQGTTGQLARRARQQPPPCRRRADASTPTGGITAASRATCCWWKRRRRSSPISARG